MNQIMTCTTATTINDINDDDDRFTHLSIHVIRRTAQSALHFTPLNWHLLYHNTRMHITQGYTSSFRAEGRINALIKYKINIAQYEKFILSKSSETRVYTVLLFQNQRVRQPLVYSVNVGTMVGKAKTLRR